MIDQIIEKYIKLRDKKAELKAELDKKTEAIDEAMKKCEGVILKHFETTGVDSVGSAAGTAFKSRVTSCTIADRDEWVRFLMQGGNWHLADIRPQKTAVAEMIEQQQDIPPGLNWRAEHVVRIRR